MVNHDALANIYKQTLEKNIIKYIASERNINLKDVMDIYYQSILSGQIEQGLYGIENLDYKYLALDLMENEPELFKGGISING